jgi:hypothetical protein
MKLAKLLTLFVFFFLSQQVIACTTPKRSPEKLNQKQGSPFKPVKKSSPLRVVAGTTTLGALNLNAQNNAQQPAPAKHKRVLFTDTSAAGVDHKAKTESQNLPNIARLAAKIPKPMSAAASPIDPQLDNEIAALQIDDPQAVVQKTDVEKDKQNAAIFTASSTAAIAEIRSKSPSSVQDYLDLVNLAFEKRDSPVLFELSKLAPNRKTQTHVLMLATLALEHIN